MFKKLFKWFYKDKPLSNNLIIRNFYSLNEMAGDLNVNLNSITKEIRDADTGEKNLSITQIKETLAILGKRWREQPAEQFIAEVKAIYERAGTN